MTIEFKLAFPYEIHVIPTVNGGVIARVGCAELTFQSTNKLLTAMREYFADPEEVEKAYNAARKASHGPMPCNGNLGSGRTVESLGPPAQDSPGPEVASEDTGPDEERTEPG